MMSSSGSQGFFGTWSSNTASSQPSRLVIDLTVTEPVLDLRRGDGEVSHCGVYHSSGLRWRV